MNESGDNTPSEDADAPAGSDTGHAQATEAIKRAIISWRRRGYRLRYQDAFLAQMTRHGGPGVLPLGLGVLLIAAVVVWWLLSRSWLVVSITATPDGHLVVHRQRSKRPPPE